MLSFMHIHPFILLPSLTEGTGEGPLGLLFILALGAAFVQRVSGFGFGIFIMTMLPYLMPSYGEATTLSGLMALVTSAIIVWKMHKFINWQKLLPILITFLIISWFAVQFVSLAGDGTLKRILGATLIIVSIWFFFFSEKVRISPTLPMQIGMGTISGIMGGLFGMQGPPAVLYFLATAEKKEEYMALAQCYFFVGNSMMTLYRAHNGFLTPIVWTYWIYGLLAVLLGTWIGALVFRRIPILILRKIIYAYMAISGIIALI